VQNRQLVTDTLTPVMKSKTTAEWIEALEALKIGTVKVIANPVKLSATPPSYRSAPPVLGEHTQDVLTDVLKMSASDITALKEKGIV